MKKSTCCSIVRILKIVEVDLCSDVVESQSEKEMLKKEIRDAVCDQGQRPQNENLEMSEKIDRNATTPLGQQIS
jgi:hypothetical protein